MLLRGRTLLVWTALLGSWCFPATAAITVVPLSPSSTDVITIRVENTFGAEATAASASISQVGNTFVIQQNVSIDCLLPSNPTVASQFAVGPLPPGSYTVTANISFTGVGPLPCSPPPITQAAAFIVSASAVPALDSVALLILGVSLAAVAMASLR